jgi:hypothetical protein
MCFCTPNYVGRRRENREKRRERREGKSNESTQWDDDWHPHFPRLKFFFFVQRKREENHKEKRSA